MLGYIWAQRVTLGRTPATPRNPENLHRPRHGIQRIYTGHATGSGGFTPATRRNPEDLHRPRHGIQRIYTARVPEGGTESMKCQKWRYVFRRRCAYVCVNGGGWQTAGSTPVGKSGNWGNLPGCEENFVTCTVLRLQNFLTQHGSWLEKIMHPGSFPLER